MVSAAASDRSLRASSCASAGAVTARPSPAMPRPAKSALFDICISPPDRRTLSIGEKSSNQTTVRVSWHRPGCRGKAMLYSRGKIGGNAMTRQALLIVGFLVVAAAAANAQQQKVGAPPEASNMRLARWIAYIGHHGGTDEIPNPVNPLTGKAEPNGTSIVDVTDPANPKYLRHLPGAPGTYEAGGAQMVRVCDGSSLPRAD